MEKEWRSSQRYSRWAAERITRTGSQLNASDRSGCRWPQSERAARFDRTVPTDVSIITWDVFDHARLYYYTRHASVSMRLCRCRSWTNVSFSRATHFLWDWFLWDRKAIQRFKKKGIGIERIFISRSKSIFFQVWIVDEFLESRRNRLRIFFRYFNVGLGKKFEAKFTIRSMEYIF